jgi:hypothetical protein
MAALRVPVVQVVAVVAALPEYKFPRQTLPVTQLVTARPPGVPVVVLAVVLVLRV